MFRFRVLGVIATGVFVLALDVALVVDLLFGYKVNPLDPFMLINFVLCGVVALIGYELIVLGSGRK
jgi:hypothetical protein